jgi:hypothetical protein
VVRGSISILTSYSFDVRGVWTYIAHRLIRLSHFTLQHSDGSIYCNNFLSQYSKTSSNLQHIVCSNHSLDYSRNHRLHRPQSSNIEFQRLENKETNHYDNQCTNMYFLVRVHICFRYSRNTRLKTQTIFMHFISSPLREADINIISGVYHTV